MTVLNALLHIVWVYPYRQNISFNFVIQNVLIHEYSRYTTTFYTSFAQDTHQTGNDKIVFICKSPKLRRGSFQNPAVFLQLLIFNKMPPTQLRVYFVTERYVFPSQ
jgi:hypothetical protein